MRKWISLFFLMIFVEAVLSCSSASTENGSNHEVSEAVGNDLPDMRILLLDQSEVYIKNLEGKVVLVFFQPDCDHCQREAAEIAQNIVAFKKVRVCFITSSLDDKIETFANEYKLDGHVNVIFGNTSIESILKNFGPIETPSIYVYSADQKLVKAFNGEVAISEVLKYI